MGTIRFWSLNYYKLASACLIVLGMISLVAFLVLSASGLRCVVGYEFLGYLGKRMEFILFVDWKSTLFARFIFWIRGRIIFYRSEYMSEERRKTLFLLLLSGFVLRILLVVFRINIVSIILGWDGLGLVSFILVIYYQRSSSVRGATITALRNRIGDGFILLGVAFAAECGVWGLLDLEVLISSEGGPLLGGLIIIAAITKRAQLPYSAWLPRAMAAPTPVSSLVHSSTLVTAGVYLLLRSRRIIRGGGWKPVLVILGITTMVFARVNASFEQDIKKVVALSTLSQLGLMVVRLGLGLIWVTLFHLLIHAVFKALLFICRGEVIHQVQGNQDLRFIGGLSLGLPITGSLINCCRLSLCGIPFLCGFYSKDAIIELGYSSEYSNIFIRFMAFRVGLSACYSFRLRYAGFVGLRFTPLGRCKEGWGRITKSKRGLFGLVLVSGLLVGGLLNWDPRILILRGVEKFISLIWVLVGGVIGFILSTLSGDELVLFPHLITLGPLRGLIHLRDVRGEGSALALENRRATLLPLRSWVGERARPLNLIAFCRNLSFSIHSQDTRSYTLVILFFRLLSLICLRNFVEYNIEAIEEDYPLSNLLEVFHL